MEPVTSAAALGAAGSIGQGLVSSAFNAWQAGKNREFQERMSNTAHQREVADLRKAGINPILSAKLGGASTPLGATAQASVPEGAVSSALQAASTRSQINLQAAQARDLNSAAALKEIEARVRGGSGMEQAQADLILQQLRAAMLAGDVSQQQYHKAIQEIKNLVQQERNLKLEGQHSAYGLAEAGAYSKFFQGMGGKISPWLEKILKSLPIPSGHYQIRGRR